jgi:hypothetical protein
VIEDLHRASHSPARRLGRAPDADQDDAADELLRS